MRVASALCCASAFCFAIISCNADHSPTREPRAMVSVADSTAAGSPAANAVDGGIIANAKQEEVLPLNAPSRKIIKTADLRCRVGDVLSATTRLEHLTASVGGQISESHLENTTDDSRSLPYKADSLRQLASYTTNAHLTLRIPVYSLDTVLADIAANAAFVDSRNLHLDDVTLRYLSNRLKNEALATNDAAQRARTLARHSRDAINSGDYTDTHDETRIDRQIENMQLTDQASYATLTVNFYQPQRLAQSIIPNTQHLMKAGMGQQLGVALDDGWQLLRAIIIALMQVWPLLLVVAGGFAAYRYRRAKRVVARA